MKTDLKLETNCVKSCALMMKEENKFTRMSTSEFDHLYSLINAKISKKDAHFREAITAIFIKIIMSILHHKHMAGQLSQPQGILF